MDYYVIAEKSLPWEVPNAFIFRANRNEIKATENTEVKTINVDSFKAIIPMIDFTIGCVPDRDHDTMSITVKDEGRERQLYGFVNSMVLHIARDINEKTMTLSQFYPKPRIKELDHSDDIIAVYNGKDGEVMTVRKALRLYGDKDVFAQIDTNAIKHNGQPTSIFVL